MMATKTGRDRVWDYEDKNVPLFQVEVCEFREIISLCDIIPQYLRLQRFFQLYSYTLGYIWIIALGLIKKTRSTAIYF